MGQGLARPPHQAHRVSFGLQFLLQVGKQRHVGLHHLFLPSPNLSNTLSRLIALSCLQFSETPFHRIERDACFTGYLADASSLFSLDSQILSPLLLIAHPPHLLRGLLM